MNQTVTSFSSSGRMTESQYDQQRADLLATYGDTTREAGAKREQAWADLFYRSGWTQEQLAQKEGKSQQRVGQSLRFGRFLNFTTTVVKMESLPNNLTERRFRSYWEQTDKNESNEYLRFREVARLMADEITLRAKGRPKIGKEIVEQFGDGKWHSVESMAKQLNTDTDHVNETMRVMRVHETYGARCEHKQVGQSTHYRIFRQTKMISSSELKTRFTPIINDLKAEGKKNMATMSPGTVARLAALLEKLLDEWSE